ncbi:hypothetical protein K2Q00_00195 [Patescibacteria group bacterium]|nr:hypothetical protein [Patescibacteria group bacterium]
MSLQSLQIGTRAWFSSLFSWLEKPLGAYLEQPTLDFKELPRLFGEGKNFEVIKSLTSTGSFRASLNNEVVQIYYASDWQHGELTEVVLIICEEKTGMDLRLTQGWVDGFARHGKKFSPCALPWHEAKMVGEFMELLYAELDLPHPFL